jgi:hypothetical protein
MVFAGILPVLACCPNRENKIDKVFELCGELISVGAASCCWYNYLTITDISLCREAEESIF